MMQNSYSSRARSRLDASAFARSDSASKLAWAALRLPFSVSSCSAFVKFLSTSISVCFAITAWLARSLVIARCSISIPPTKPFSFFRAENRIQSSAERKFDLVTESSFSRVINWVLYRPSRYSLIASFALSRLPFSRSADERVRCANFVRSSMASSIAKVSRRMSTSPFFTFVPPSTT